MYYIQHKHHNWIKWQRWGAYLSKEKAQEAFDSLQMLNKVKPSTIDGVRTYNEHKEYEYRLSSE